MRSTVPLITVPTAICDSNCSPGVEPSGASARPTRRLSKSMFVTSTGRGAAASAACFISAWRLRGISFRWEETVDAGQQLDEDADAVTRATRPVTT